MQPVPLSKPMTPELARAVYAVLVAGCGANAKPGHPDDFVDWLMVPKADEAWDFGYGKFYADEKGMMIDADGVDPSRVDRTMRALAVLMEGK